MAEYRDALAKIEDYYKSEEAWNVGYYTMKGIAREALTEPEAS